MSGDIVTKAKNAKSEVKDLSLTRNEARLLRRTLRGKKVRKLSDDDKDNIKQVRRNIKKLFGKM
jgi:DNA-binding CsgD family transcriptional regulator